MNQAGQRCLADSDENLQELRLSETSIKKKMDVLGRYLAALTDNLMCEFRQGGQAQIAGFLASTYGVQDALFGPLRLSKRRMGGHTVGALVVIASCHSDDL